MCRDADLVTITNKEDLEKAMAESLIQAERLQASHGQQGRYNAQAMLPPMRFSLQKVASEVGIRFLLLMTRPGDPPCCICLHIRAKVCSARCSLHTWLSHVRLAWSNQAMCYDSDRWAAGCCLLHRSTVPIRVNAEWSVSESWCRCDYGTCVGA